MKYFGNCGGCHEFGALWPVTITVRKYWFFGPRIPHEILRCDECSPRYCKGASE